MLLASPIAIALGIVGAVAVAGLVIALLGRRSTFAGYAEIAGDARAILRSMRGEVFRDGADLVVSGAYRQMTTVVRFSHAENTPGLNLRMDAPATFNLTVTAKGARSPESRALVRTGDEIFDSRFLTRSDDPTHARMFFGDKGTMSQLQKLCCSAGTFVSVTTGDTVRSRGIELSELVIPAPYCGQHVLDHLESMRKLATALEAMPGATVVKAKPLAKERKVGLRVAIAVGVVFAVIAVVTANRVPKTEVAASTAQLPAGISPADAQAMGGLSGTRLATRDDFDPQAVAWLEGTGRQASARVQGDFSGQPNGRDVAYVLVRKDGARRVVLLIDGVTSYDAEFSFIGIVARFPKASVPSTDWVGKSPGDVDGDGVLIVRKQDDPGSALVIFSAAKRIVTAVPVNYQNVDLR